MRRRERGDSEATWKEIETTSFISVLQFPIVKIIFAWEFDLLFRPLLFFLSVSLFFFFFAHVWSTPFCLDRICSTFHANSSLLWFNKGNGVEVSSSPLSPCIFRKPTQTVKRKTKNKKRRKKNSLTKTTHVDRIYAQNIQLRGTRSRFRPA